jgi:hypothetical protein
MWLITRTVAKSEQENTLKLDSQISLQLHNHQSWLHHRQNQYR